MTCIQIGTFGPMNQDRKLRWNYDQSDPSRLIGASIVDVRPTDEQTRAEIRWQNGRGPNGSRVWEVERADINGQIVPFPGDSLLAALMSALESVGYRVMDHANFPPGKIADFKSDKDFARDVAGLRTGLSSIYEKVKDFETKLRDKPYSKADLAVNGDYAMLAAMFDWFSVSMLNLMEGVSFLDQLATKGSYSSLVSNKKGRESVSTTARKYADSIYFAEPLRRWRNKVAAHRSGIHPRGNSESIETMLMSLMGSQVTAENRRFVAGALKRFDFGYQQPTAKAKTAKAEKLIKWSLTTTWESLASNRYRWLNDGTFFEELNKDVMAIEITPAGPDRDLA